MTRIHCGCLIFVLLLPTVDGQNKGSGLSQQFAALLDAYDLRSFQLKLYSCNLSEWYSIETLLKVLIVNQVNKLCEAQPQRCCLTKWTNSTWFHPDMLLSAPGFPLVEFSFVRDRFVLLYPPPALPFISRQKICSFAPMSLDPLLLDEALYEQNGSVETVNEALGDHWTLIVPSRRHRNRLEKLVDLVLLPAVISALILVIPMAHCCRRTNDNSRQRYRDGRAARERQAKRVFHRRFYHQLQIVSLLLSLLKQQHQSDLNQVRHQTAHIALQSTVVPPAEGTAAALEVEPKKQRARKRSKARDNRVADANGKRDLDQGRHRSESEPSRKSVNRISTTTLSSSLEEDDVF